MISALPRDHDTYNIPATKENSQTTPSPTMTQENDKLEAIKELMESKFSQIKERISSVEQ